MSIKTNHNTLDKIWFITFTCFDWIPLFQNTDSYDLVYNWFRIIKAKNQADTLAFIIMPNHLHVIFHLKSEGINLNLMVSNAKRFMAYEIIKRLKANNNQLVLKKLTDGCSEKEKSKGQLHKVFEPSFDAKPIYNDQFFYQKLDYIHRNSVTGKWSLENDFVDYKHSSASFYENGVVNELVDILDFRNVL